MHKIFTLALLSATLAMGAVSHAQTNLPAYQVKQNMNWVMSSKLRLDFNSGAPVVGTSKITGYYGGSSISDNSGQLLMYAKKDTIWDKNGNPMPNGTGNLTNNPGIYQFWGGSQDDSRIVPVIANPNQYYVFSKTSAWASTNFTLAPGTDPMAGRLFYSVVDMTLNGGLGDVVPGQKRIQLDSMLVDRSVVVKGSQCNMWLLTLHYHSFNYSPSADTALEIHAFEINANGINPNPVISPITNEITPGLLAQWFMGTGNAYFGQMLASPDNSKLAITLGGYAQNINTTSFSGGGFILFDFDNTTGIVSNQIFVTPPATGFDIFTNSVSDICFSPDNTKLYTTHGYYGFGRGLDQFDITGGNAAAIIASRVNLDVGNEGWGSGMRLGPDHKIYISALNSTNGQAVNSIHRIENPNLSGTASTLTLNAITLPPGKFIYCGLGAATVDRPQIDSAYAVHNQFLCSESPALTLSVPYKPNYNYQWSNGASTNENIITQPGTFWVKYGNYCERLSDTFHILPLDLSPNFGPDRVVCGDIDPPIMLQANNIPGASYEWQDGSSASSFTITDSGTYYVTIRKAQCVGTDTIRVDVYDVFQNIGNDTVVCENTPFHIELGARVPAGASALWSTGETTDSIQVTQPGTYTVTVSQDICSSSDSVSITTEMCDCITFMPNAFSPNGDGLNDVFVPQFETGCEITGYTLQVFNRYGQKIFETIKPGAGWNGTHNGTPVDPGTYMFTISYDKGTQHHAYVLKGDLTLIR